MLELFRRRRYTKHVEAYTFDKLRNKIETAVRSKIELFPTLYGGDTDFELINGYVYQTTQMNIEGAFVGASAVPMICIISKGSARIHLFALSALLPEEFKQIKALRQNVSNG